MDGMNYDKLPGFEDVYLEDSFVRAIFEDETSTRFMLLLALLPGHPLYEEPRPLEPHCFRTATLTFPRVRKRTWHVQGTDQEVFTDADGAVDYGNVDRFTAEADGSYRLSGEWGDLALHSDPPYIHTHHPETHAHREARRAYARWVGGGPPGEHS
jgi:hypothetical protein